MPFVYHPDSAIETGEQRPPQPRLPATMTASLTEEQARELGMEVTGTTFVLPAVSIGNVGQLALDVVVHTLGMERVGYLYTNTVLPMVGPDAYGGEEEGETRLSVSCEVFYCRERGLLVLQQRAPVCKGREKAYVEEINQFVRECGRKPSNGDRVEEVTSSSLLAGVVILTGCDSRARPDPGMNYGQYSQNGEGNWEDDGCRYLLSNESDDHPLLEVYHSGAKAFEMSSHLVTRGVDEKYLRISGGGQSRKLYEALGKIERLPVAVLVCYCGEGDNIPDAYRLVKFAERVLMCLGGGRSSELNGEDASVQDMMSKVSLDANGNEILVQEYSSSSAPVASLGCSIAWRAPLSWRHLFGSRPDPVLYG
eukprot:Nk52_evm54s2391 gene=Nk52_evmTU54s2391